MHLNCKMILKIILLIGLFSNANLAKKYDGYQVWRMFPEDENSLHLLQRLSETNTVEFWKDPIKVGLSVDIKLSPENTKYISSHLHNSGINYEVIIEDIQNVIDEQQRNRINKKRSRSFGKVNLDTFDYTQYHTADEIYEWMDLITAKYSFINKEKIGVTYEGRPIYVLEITKPKSVTTRKPVIYLDALIHCREWITTSSMIKVFSDMLSDSKKEWMVNDIDWYFIPMINVDGYVHTHNEDRLWRKTRASGASIDCIGVDANRNWDDHWSGPGSSTNPCSLFFHGPTAESESEVRHLANYILNREIDGLLTVHSYSQLILYPYNYDYHLPPDNEELNITAKAMHDAIKSVHGMTYKYGPGADTIYQSSGVTPDWTYNVANITMSYTYELRDTGNYGFLLPDDQIVPTAEEFAAALEIFANAIKTRFESSK